LRRYPSTRTVSVPSDSSVPSSCLPFQLWALQMLLCSFACQSWCR
jgi:hypothetical protein